MNIVSFNLNGTLENQSTQPQNRDLDLSMNLSELQSYNAQQNLAKLDLVMSNLSESRNLSQQNQVIQQPDNVFGFGFGFGSGSGSGFLENSFMVPNFADVAETKSSQVYDNIFSNDVGSANNLSLEAYIDDIINAPMVSGCVAENSKLDNLCKKNQFVPGPDNTVGSGVFLRGNTNMVGDNKVSVSQSDIFQELLWSDKPPSLYNNAANSNNANIGNTSIVSGSGRVSSTTGDNSTFQLVAGETKQLNFDFLNLSSLSSSEHELFLLGSSQNTINNNNSNNVDSSNGSTCWEPLLNSSVGGTENNLISNKNTISNTSFNANDILETNIKNQNFLTNEGKCSGLGNNRNAALRSNLNSQSQNYSEKCFSSAEASEFETIISGGVFNNSSVLENQACNPAFRGIGSANLSTLESNSYNSLIYSGILQNQNRKSEGVLSYQAQNQNQNQNHNQGENQPKKARLSSSMSCDDSSEAAKRMNNKKRYMQLEYTSEELKRRKYECKFCKKRFLRPSSLKTHIYVHTGEKPFVCKHPNCTKSFAVLSNLRRHNKVHFNPKKLLKLAEKTRKAMVQQEKKRLAKMGKSASAKTRTDECDSNLNINNYNSVIATYDIQEMALLGTGRDNIGNSPSLHASETLEYPFGFDKRSAEPCSTFSAQNSIGLGFCSDIAGSGPGSGSVPGSNQLIDLNINVNSAQDLDINECLSKDATANQLYDFYVNHI